MSLTLHASLEHFRIIVIKSVTEHFASTTCPTTLEVANKAQTQQLNISEHQFTTQDGHSARGYSIHGHVAIRNKEKEGFWLGGPHFSAFRCSKTNWFLYILWIECAKTYRFLNIFELNN